MFAVVPSACNDPRVVSPSHCVDLAGVRGNGEVWVCLSDVMHMNSLSIPHSTS